MISRVFGGLESFKIAAHEYAHGFNRWDYALQDEWQSEGHSQWAMLRAIGDFYGPDAQDREFRDELKYVKDEDAAGRKISLLDDTDNFHGRPTYGYCKAAIFWELLAGKLPLDDLNAIVTKGTSGADATKNLLDAVSSHPHFTGQKTQTMWNGWFDGEYADSIFPIAEIEGDPQTK